MNNSYKELLNTPHGWHHKHIWLQIFIVVSAFIVIYVIDEIYFAHKKKLPPLWLKILILLIAEIVLVYLFSAIFNSVVVVVPIH